MKTIKIITSLALLLIATNLYANNNKEVEMENTDIHNDMLKSTIVKKYKMNNNDENMTYKIKVYESRDYHVVLDKNDKYKTNQDIVFVPADVTKRIYLDNDKDKNYDSYFVLTYKKSLKDSFKTIMTENGIAILIDGKHIEYLNEEGTYFINNNDNDFFTVTEHKIL
ncbi:hypothetical protein [Urechidicola croceus]|uniref:Uncharacterized protein n=1 Tax=Urechidicola croceus TaxID=1850246 RepID=A0A1D8PAA7_9FLAO|nr:hypothetical protein [Urechidicola croceus]AOW21512.1 hypothetical protein LPB138_12855 [Urechidicola croceus]